MNCGQSRYGSIRLPWREHIPYHQSDQLASEQQGALWDALHKTIDFSWTGLTDANWALQAPNAWAIGPAASLDQEMKRWRAPLDFPVESAEHHDEEGSWKEATLQDYWRWVPGSDGEAPDRWSDGRLASDKELKALGYLVRYEGQWWHVAHLPPQAFYGRSRGEKETAKTRAAFDR